MSIILGLTQLTRHRVWRYPSGGTPVNLPRQWVYSHQSGRSAVAPEAHLCGRVGDHHSVSAGLFRHRAGLYGENADSALKLGQARGVAIVAAVNRDLPVFEYAARQVKQTVVGIGSAEKSGAAHGAYPAEAPCEPAGRRRGCAGHCDYPLSRQPECDANERVAAQSGARQVTIMTNQAGCLSSLFIMSADNFFQNAGASRDRQTQRHHH